MRLLLKATGVLSILGAVLFLLLLFDDFDFVNAFFVILLAVIGLFLLKYKPVKQRTEKYSPNAAPVNKKEKLGFKVKGVTYENEDGKPIQSLIKQIVSEHLEEYDAYEGLSKKEMCEDYEGERIYQIDSAGVGDIDLVPDMNNEHDPNAVKVYHRELGHLGYVPKEKTSMIKDILRKDGLKYKWFITGGKYKVCRDGEVEENEDDYGMRIEILYSR